MVSISIEDIIAKLQDVLDGKISREDASDWAYSMMLEQDNDNLLYVPAEKEDLIWDTITFVQAVDLQTDPGVYLLGAQEDILLQIQTLKKLTSAS